MKRQLMFIFVVLMSVCSAQAEELSACGHHDYAPWNWEKNGEIVGVCAEVTKTLFGKLGFEVDLSYQGPWARCQKNIESGAVDINICSFINDKRQTYSQFIPTPMGVNENAVFVKKGKEFPFSVWSNLDGKKAGLVLGVSIGQRYDNYLKENVEVVRVNSFSQLFRMLAFDRIDFVPTGRFSGRAMLQSYGLGEEIIDLPEAILLGNLYISMSKKSPHLSALAEVEKAIQKTGYKSWVDELMVKYTKLYVEDYRIKHLSVPLKGEQ